MAGERRAFREAVRSNGAVMWVDHAAVVADDLAALRSVERLTLWNVTIVPGVLAALPNLWWLDVRGGSVRSFPPVAEAGRLRYLRVNQVTGLTDLSWLDRFPRLELLELYGLPRVRELPSLRNLTALRRVELGSMKGLHSLAGLIDAPALRELQLTNAVSLTEGDVDGLDSHPTLSAFAWFAPDVPVRVTQPVRERLSRNRERAAGVSAATWFGIAEPDGVRPGVAREPDAGEH